MDAWTLARPARPRPTTDSMAGVIEAIGQPGFARTALDHLNQSLAAGSWAVYRVWQNRPPVMYLSASRDAVDTTGVCFGIYRDQGLYRRDRSFEAVRQTQRPGHAVLLRMHADDAPNAEHRNAIYLRHGMLERLSVARLEDDGSLTAVNLYHHAHQGRFDPAEVEHFADMAPLLMACVTRQVAWQQDAPQAGLRERLAQRCAQLTGRELDVLERLLRGMSYDGIAADLGLGVASVKTYRARAFGRLDMHFKSELFASFLPARPGCPPLG
jgi:DNA-binding CsgD family transcriptional regulator